MIVWVEDWEMQCCGNPFTVGSEVEWGLVSLTQDVHDFREYLTVPLGEAAANAITHYETHHHGEDEPQPVPTRARVVSINAAYWRLALEETGRIGMPRVMYPAAGTGVLKPRQDANGWEPEEQGLRFDGYIVELEPID